MPRIIGTAGHIDHGKTALVRALTGIETDRLKEEKERGISIDIGFAFLDLGGERVGIVDVPGHERFIRNMLAGAHGIDLVLLVVAADDGVMPQTEEHLDIVHLLGTRRGVVAVTKCDLVDDARLRAVEEEIEILVAGTALESAPVVRVSSVSGGGIERLRAVLAEEIQKAAMAAHSPYFRLPVDRVFSLHGFGTVVTGTAIGGTVEPGAILRLLPGGAEVRVRTIQVHDQDVAIGVAGQRIALNVVGVEREQMRRGQVLVDARLSRVTDRFDARIEVRPGVGESLRSHQPIRLHVGTAEEMGKVIVLDGAELRPRTRGFAQIVLRSPVQVLPGDRFVIRDQGARRTLGGGVVVRPHAPRYRRRVEACVKGLSDIDAADGDAGLVAAVLRLENRSAVEIDELAESTGLLPEAMIAAGRSDAGLRLLPDAAAPLACALAERWLNLRDKVVAFLGEFHRAHAKSGGAEMELVRSRVVSDLSPKVFRVLVDGLVAEGMMVREESVLHLPGHRVKLERGDTALAGSLSEALSKAGFTPPSVADLAVALQTSPKQVQAVLRQMERDGRVAKLDENLYFAAAPLERARELLKQHIAAHGQIGAAEFRDLLGASRKFSIGLLDYFDRTGFTLRVGDNRKLRRG